jgi:starch-binding outer membrane protein, SusD/RagB family
MSPKKIALALILVASFVSCKKVLDVEPQFDLDGTNRFKSLDDYDFALVGAYRLFQSTSYYGSTDGRSNAFVTLPDMLSDNLNETSESLGNERVFSRWAYSEDEDQIERTWLAAYRIISQANLVTRGIDNFSATNATGVNRIKGQALAIRAMVHFDVLRYWVNDYDRNSSSPGIPYITLFDYEQKPARGTVKQTYDAIEQDLKSARALLSNTDKPVNAGSTRAYIDRIAVDAMLARMYLYSNQFDSAIKYSTLVINAIPLGDINEFPSIWTDASNAEVVWSLVFDAGQGSPAANAYFPSTDRSSYRPNQTLVASYDQANDIRFFSYFQVISGRRVLSKYLAKEAQLANPDGVTNFKVFRTGEMYVIRAEAYARKGVATEVLGLADLNALRAARIFGYAPVVLSGSALLDAIAMERRKELIAEGHRWFDLKRTTKTVSRANCTSFCTLPPTSRAWTWPVPQPEIDANPNILPQNPGY